MQETPPSISTYDVGSLPILWFGRDPMEWLGWNVLLEGRKLWTFLPPSPELDAPLGTYRLAPNAFGEHNISAGWQSDVDLFRRRTSVSWPLACEEKEIWRLTTSGVQEPGDIVIIPPRYWHQVRTDSFNIPLILWPSSRAVGAVTRGYIFPVGAL